MCETASHTEDLRRHGPCLKREVQEGLHDYIFEQQLLAWQSMRPIHQIVLDMEHVWLATAYRTVRKFCSSDQVSAFVTDACLSPLAGAEAQAGIKRAGPQARRWQRHF